MGVQVPLLHIYLPFLWFVLCQALLQELYAYQSGKRLPLSPRRRNDHWPQFPDQETEARRGEIVRPGSQSWRAGVPIRTQAGFELTTCLTTSHF